MSIEDELLASGHELQMKEWCYGSSTLGNGGFIWKWRIISVLFFSLHLTYCKATQAKNLLCLKISDWKWCCNHHPAAGTPAISLHSIQYTIIQSSVNSLGYWQMCLIDFLV